MKLWFKQKISKEEFDLEARRLLTQDNGKKPTCVCFLAGFRATLPLPGLGDLLPAAPCLLNGCVAVREVRMAKDPVARRVKKVGGALPCRKKSLWPRH